MTELFCFGKATILKLNINRLYLAQKLNLYRMLPLAEGLGKCIRIKVIMTFRLITANLNFWKIPKSVPVYFDQEFLQKFTIV